MSASSHTQSEALPDIAPYTIDVRSETGLLQRVVVHTPAQEMTLVAPNNLESLLFEDILYLDRARKEHLLMCEVFRKVVGKEDAVLEISDLLYEAFLQEEARVDFVEQFCRLYPASNLQAFDSELKRLSPAELHLFALTGTSPLPINAQPLPNLMFTRDVACVVGNHILLSHPATAARARESLITSTVLHHHPGFANHRDNIIKLPKGVTFEGGDMLVVSDKVVLIGHSERTSFGGVMKAAQALFAHTSVEHLVMVNLPKQRACMHLDTVFTFASPSECVVFPPLIELSDLGNVVVFSPSDDPLKLSCTVQKDLHSTLETLLNRSITFIPCGGGSLLSQQREQWTDGANLFAMGPGIVIGYERNRVTFDLMRDHGYRVVSAQGFLDYYAESDFAHGEKMAIKLEGHELSRGRGGARCMTMPLARLPLS